MIELTAEDFEKFTGRELRIPENDRYSSGGFSKMNGIVARPEDPYPRIIITFFRR
ncbi:hypothetical protein [Methanoregula sp.]|uniref:hypothetical protein n=1 Tax=Methanoregula sp. TaxID=2052170 RepID=UPI002C460A82|nr:hypothetical protein [Methanoregula sp.]HVP97042.1 hypothetical protein [Methanoregula sp.]